MPQYKFLIPYSKIDEDGLSAYSEALEQALKEGNVTNVAISGDYGSGKSSVIESFKKNNSNGYEFLDVSLATFQAEKPHDLERGILQYMFFKVSPSDLPKSRFKRISQTPGKWSLLFYVSAIVVAILSYYVTFNANEVVKLFKGTPQGDITLPILLAGSIIFLLGSIFFLVKLILDHLHNVSFSKINLGNLELSTQDEGKSLLNKHLDEILYFFQQTKYNVVVFQDLDRFDDINIFTKLREINKLINASDQVDGKVVFLYAIKDSLLDSLYDKPKFFDFVIPIIPYINSSNSYDKLENMFNDTSIDTFFLREVSLYIDDMRLLNNIFNEYQIYNQAIGQKLSNKNNLLAMIIYKNFLPRDFSSLHKNQGVVFNIFNRSSLNNEVKLRAEQAAKELRDTNPQDPRAQELRAILDQLDGVKNKTIKELCNNNKLNLSILSEIDGGQIKHKKLLRYLIKNGYIDNHYSDYMSYTHKDIIDSNDWEFLRSITDDIPLDIGYKLNNVSSVVHKIRPSSFSKPSTLNFDLVEHISNSHSKYADHNKFLFEQLSKKSVHSSEHFLHHFLRKTDQSNTFFGKFVYHYDGFWDYVSSSNSFSESDKNILLSQLINRITIERIVELNDNKSVEQYLANLKTFPPEVINKQFIDLLKKVNAKLSRLESIDNNGSLFESIYRDNLYELNITLINTIFTYFEPELLNKLHESRLSTIQSSDLDILKNRIENNINEYVENVSLKEPSLALESENTITSLLNNKNLKNELKSGLIGRNIPRISDISEIEQQDLWGDLFNLDKVAPMWNNILHYYEYSGRIDEYLISYLNTIDNSISLAKVKVGVQFCKQNTLFDDNTISKLLKEILINHDLEIDSYKLLVSSNGYYYNNLDIQDLSEEKIDTLVNQRKLGFTSENFERLRSSNKHISLIEEYGDDYVDSFDKFEITSDDLSTLLNSESLTRKQKQDIVSKVDVNLIVDTETAEYIYELMPRNLLNQRIPILLQIAKKISSSKIKVKITNILVETYELKPDKLLGLLQYFPQEFAKISKLNGKQSSIPLSASNKQFAQNLKNLGLITSFRTNTTNPKNLRLYIKREK